MSQLVRMPAAGRSAAHANRLLADLSAGERERLAPQLKRVHVERGRIAYAEGRSLHYVTFPVEAVLSIVVTLEAGDTCEVATIGREGFVGLDAALGSATARRTISCQFSGEAELLPVGAFVRELARDAGFAALVRRNIRARLFAAEQLAACNARHSVSQRCARWLTRTVERLGRPVVPITREALAGMLGTRRASICEALSHLEDIGAIAGGRGFVEVLDPDELRAQACACLEAIEDAYRQAR